MLQKLLLCCSFFLTCINGFAQAPATTEGYKKIAGIEVGSKGVKLSILERSLTQKNDFRLLKDSAVNADMISFTNVSNQAALNAITGLYQYANSQWGIPSADIATLISSGVKAQADKLGKQQMIQDLVTAFRNNINEPGRVVEVVTVQKESILSHYGIISDAERYSTFLIDIGSGNTKGGYFNGDTKEFVMFQIPSGTKSTTNAADKNCGGNCAFPAFRDFVTPVVDTIEKNEIIYAVNASGAYPSSSTMAISGGIAWAVATLLFPEKTAQQQVDVSYKDVSRFREGLLKYYADIPDTNKLQIRGMSPEGLTKIRRELQKVINVFDTRALLAGSSLLLRIMRQFEAVNSSKKFRLIKNGQVGWITGYILDKDRKE